MRDVAMVTTLVLLLLYGGGAGLVAGMLWPYLAEAAALMQRLGPIISQLEQLLKQQQPPQ